MAEPTCKKGGKFEFDITFDVSIFLIGISRIICYSIQNNSVTTILKGVKGHLNHGIIDPNFATLNFNLKIATLKFKVLFFNEGM